MRLCITYIIIKYTFSNKFKPVDRRTYSAVVRRLSCKPISCGFETRLTPVFVGFVSLGRCPHGHISHL